VILAKGFTLHWAFPVIYACCIFAATNAALYLWFRQNLKRKKFVDWKVKILHFHARAIRENFNRINAMDAAQAVDYVDALSGRRKKYPFATALEILPWSDFLSKKEDQKRIFELLMRRKLQAGSVSSAHITSESAIWSLLVDAIPDYSNFRVFCCLVSPVAISVGIKTVFGFPLSFVPYTLLGLIVVALVLAYHYQKIVFLSRR